MRQSESCVVSDILLFDYKMLNAMLPKINSCLLVDTIYTSIQIIIYAIAMTDAD